MLGADVNIAEDHAGDGGFGEAVDGSGGGDASGGQVFDQDVVEVRGEAGDGCGGYIAGRSDFGVVLADDEGVLDVLHVDVAEDEVADVVAAVAVGFNADTVVGLVEVDALGGDVLGAADDFTTDGEAVAVEEGAVGDGDVAGGRVGAGGVGFAGLDGDVVVAYVGEDMVDLDVGGGEGIDGVGVGGVLRGEDFDVADGDVVGVVGNELPHGRVLDGDAFDEDVLTVVEDDEARAGVFAAYYAGVFEAAGLQPPALPCPVDDAFAGDGNVVGVSGADEGLEAGGAELGDGGIVGVVGGAE